MVCHLRSIIIILLVSQINSAIGQVENVRTQYELLVEINPSTEILIATAHILNPPSAHFFLNDRLKIQSLVGDGKAIEFHQNNSDKKLPYTAGSKENINIQNFREVRYLRQSRRYLTGPGNFNFLFDPKI